MEKFWEKKNKNSFNLSPAEGGAWIFLEEHFPGKRSNKMTGKDRREFQQSFGITGWEKTETSENEFYLKLLLLPPAEGEK